MRPLTLLLVGIIAIGAPSAAPSGKPSEEDSLAGESLRSSAMGLLNVSGNAPARSVRLVSTVRFAKRFDPGNPQTHLMLADIFEVQGNFARAAESLKICLARNPINHALGVRWVDLKLSGLHTADERIVLLQSLIDDETFPPALRAEAAVQRAKILGRQGKKLLTVEALREAMKLDPTHPAALTGLLALEDDLSPPRQVQMLLGLLRGNPLSTTTVRELCVMLNSLGLYDESLEMFDYAWVLSQRSNPGEEVSQQFIIQYFSAMLDAGRFQEALAKFAPMRERFPDNFDLKMLMVEAHQALGTKETPERIIQSIESRNNTSPKTPIRSSMSGCSRTSRATKSTTYNSSASGRRLLTAITHRRTMCW